MVKVVVAVAEGEDRTRGLVVVVALMGLAMARRSESGFWGSLRSYGSGRTQYRKFLEIRNDQEVSGPT